VLNYARLYRRRNSDEDVEIKDIPKYGWRTTDAAPELAPPLKMPEDEDDSEPKRQRMMQFDTK